MEKAINILEQEVRWHQDNNAPGISKNWRKGFIAGCEHCLCVLVRCDEASQSEVQADAERCIGNVGPDCDTCKRDQQYCGHYRTA